MDGTHLAVDQLFLGKHILRAKPVLAIVPLFAIAILVEFQGKRCYFTLGRAMALGTVVGSQKFHLAV